MTRTPHTMDSLPIFRLAERVMLPRTRRSLDISKREEVGLMNHILSRNKRSSLPLYCGVTTRVPSKEPLPEDLAGFPIDKEKLGVLEGCFSMGCLVRIVELREVTSPSGRSYSATVEGVDRIRVLRVTRRSPFWMADVERVDAGLLTNGESKEDSELEASVIALQDAIRKVLDWWEEGAGRTSKSRSFRTETISNMKALTKGKYAEDPTLLANAFVTLCPSDTWRRQVVLETDSQLERVKLALRLAHAYIGTLSLSSSISDEIRSKIRKNQRRHFLQHQLNVIKKELGAGGGDGRESDEEEGGEEEEPGYATLRRKLLAAKLPPDAWKVVAKDLSQLKRMSGQEHNFWNLYTSLELVAELPWNVTTVDNTSIIGAKLQLDSDHDGLEKVKQRVLEFLAVRTIHDGGHAPILCLVGPPGVGKTSLGQSIAKCLGRKFGRVALGGVRDESEIRGHRRTYVGAMPGRFIQAMKRIQSKNPVILLDEIDKLGRDWRGDPTSALLELLDPEQNKGFRDHYLNLPFDMSHTIFLATANSLDTIPAPLLDRMEVIRIPGYTREEKARIGRNHLLPRQMARNGLEPGHVDFSDEAIALVVRAYTREAGVRNFERKLAAVCRSIAVKLSEWREAQFRGEMALEASFGPITVDEDLLTKVLGPPKFEDNPVARARGRPGVAVGLAWTPAGGEALLVEASWSPGSGNLLLTGKLGDVMKESVRAALSWIRAHAEELDISASDLKTRDIHVHFPAGAIPKDGPSAGVAIVTALVSLAKGVPMRSDMAMTGEVSLTGDVLPVGGIKEKLTGALQSGLTRVLLPDGNRRDVEEVPSSVLDKLDIVFAKTTLGAIRSVFPEGEEWLDDPTITTTRKLRSML